MEFIKAIITGWVAIGFFYIGFNLPYWLGMATTHIAIIQ